MPDGVLVAATAILLGLGGAWWTTHAPAPPPADPGVRAGNVLVRSIGDGVTVPHRYVSPHCDQAPGLRTVGQDDLWQRC